MTSQVNCQTWEEFRVKYGLHDFTDWRQYSISLARSLKDTLVGKVHDIDFIKEKVEHLIECLDCKPYTSIETNEERLQRMICQIESMGYVVGVRRK